MHVFKQLYQGRINRRNYLIGLLIDLLLFITAMVYAANLSSPFTLLIEGCLLCITFGYFLSLYFRRFHDIGVGWNGIGLSFSAWKMQFFVALFRSGEKKTNKYGVPPGKQVTYKTLLGL